MRIAPVVTDFTFTGKGNSELKSVFDIFHSKWNKCCDLFHMLRIHGELNLIVDVGKLNIV